MIYDGIAELVGNTPMIKLSRLVDSCNLKANIYGKAEFYNPTFSVKDRPALAMLEDALKNKQVTTDNIFVEATSGNMGISLAALSASYGLTLTLIMPENMSSERMKLIKHFGAQIILTPAADGMSGAIKKSEEMASQDKNIILLKQFENICNPTAHSFGTAVEILEDMDGCVDAVVCGVGTAGTISGISSVLKKVNPDIYMLGVEPSSSPVLSGGKKGLHKILGIGAGFVPKFYNPKDVNEVMKVSDENAIDMAKLVAKLEGLPVGISAGAALYAAVEFSKRSEMKGKNIVVILPSSTERYLSLGVFDE